MKGITGTWPWGYVERWSRHVLHAGQYPAGHQVRAPQLFASLALAADGAAPATGRGVHLGPAQCAGVASLPGSSSDEQAVWEMPLQGDGVDGLPAWLVVGRGRDRVPARCPEPGPCSGLAQLSC